MSEDFFTLNYKLYMTKAEFSQYLTHLTETLYQGETETREVVNNLYLFHELAQLHKGEAGFSN